MTSMITKLDVARAAGVSHTCVSQVMNQVASARISEATRQRVLATARSLGYVPGPTSRGQVRSNLIAYILCSPSRPEITHGYWHFGVLHELQQVALADDRSITFLATTNHAQSMRETLRAVDITRPLGVILDGTVPEAMVTEISQRKIPLVITGVTSFAHDAAWQGKVSTVSVDTTACVQRLLDVLRSRGSKRIALISRPPHLLVNQFIVQAYRDYLEQQKLNYDPALVQIGDEGTAIEVFARYQHLGITFDGLLLGNATMAAAVVTYLRANRQSQIIDEQRIAFLGHIEAVSESIQNLSACGVSCAVFSQAVYQQLSELLNYGPHKQQHVVVAADLHEGIH